MTLDLGAYERISDGLMRHKAENLTHPELGEQAAGAEGGRTRSPARRGQPISKGLDSGGDLDLA